MISATFKDEELGIEAFVAENAKGYYVSVRDTDANEVIPFGVIFKELKDAINAAKGAVA